jgi:UDP-N-acetylglucosamine 1-carboxyvinyltransferase
MTEYVIRGGKPLYGEIDISGAKNAAVAIIPAALLVDGICRIENIPQVSDVTLLLKILREMGADVRTVNKHTMEIDCRGVRPGSEPTELMGSNRASYYFIGSMLGKFGRAKSAMPGGCDFGVRPIDQHVKGFTALGASVEVRDGLILAKTGEDGLVGTRIYLDVVSVGATMNVMLAAARAKGRTIIENAAKEPHIVDLANFLNSMGADVKGAGTSIIKINGVEHMKGGSYSIIPDQIEAGTYMAAVAAAGGEVLIRNVIPKHLECITAKLVEMGVEIEERGDAVLVKRTKPLRCTNVKATPYPGFPTDMQPQITTVLSLARGTSVVVESIFDNRFMYADELALMGTNIKVEGNVAVVTGVEKLTGAEITAPDLRAGAALVLAGLAADGVTVVNDVEYIQRGYEHFEKKLQGLGALIELADSERDVKKFMMRVG